MAYCTYVHYVVFYTYVQLPGGNSTKDLKHLFSRYTVCLLNKFFIYIYIYLHCGNHIGWQIFRYTRKHLKHLRNYVRPEQIHIQQ